MTRQIGKVRRLVRPLGDRHVVSEILHGEERDDFIERALHEELHLAVLVGGAHRGNRSGSPVHQGAAPILSLAQTLGPELTVPFRELPEPVTVRHEHMELGAQGRIGGPEEGAIEGGTILQQLVGLCRIQRLPGAGQQLLDVDAHECCGEKPHGRQNTESPANLGWNFQGRDPIPVGDFTQRPHGLDR